MLFYLVQKLDPHPSFNLKFFKGNLKKTKIMAHGSTALQTPAQVRDVPFPEAAGMPV